MCFLTFAPIPHQFSIRPTVVDTSALILFENLLIESDNRDTLIKSLGFANIADMDSLYKDFSPMLVDNCVRFKLAGSKDEFKVWPFLCNNKLFTPSTLDSMNINDNITILVEPSLYFNIAEKRYGWFTKIKQLDWDDKAEDPVMTPVKPARTRAPRTSAAGGGGQVAGK